MTRYYMSDGVQDLDVLVDDDADLDGEFAAICLDTGQTLKVKGWLIDQLAEMPL
ncbi:hypothetical protein [Sphingomonas alpina]|uniref:Uncharacterized protein n=1 Tax=Sphingomonas alpina TaxID=653931 RepID=A0A7H0LHW0_9SPHN|nr:hypothetical protein [Sphingomonas alpina]QNQ09263.1 hypothetical protein H3Z74_21755 [Sphingomonas alpina]